MDIFLRTWNSELVVSVDTIVSFIAVVTQREAIHMLHFV